MPAAARLCLLLAACVCCVIECSAISRIYPLFFEFTTTCPCPLDLGLWGVPLNHFRTVTTVRSDLFLAARAWIYSAPEPLFSLLLSLKIDGLSKGKMRARGGATRREPRRHRSCILYCLTPRDLGIFSRPRDPGVDIQSIIVYE